MRFSFLEIAGLVCEYLFSLGNLKLTRSLDDEPIPTYKRALIYQMDAQSIANAQNDFVIRHTLVK